MDHIAHIKNTGGLDNDSVTEEKVSEHLLFDKQNQNF